MVTKRKHAKGAGGPKSLDAFFRSHPGLSHQWLADQLGIDRSYVTKMRGRKRQPSLPLALRIERITGVPADALVAA